MTTAGDPLAPPFAWVPADHPFHATLHTLATAVASDDAAQALVRAGRQADARVQVHAEIKAGRLSSGQWIPARCYWSVQLRDDSARLGMRARTMTWDGTGAERLPRWTDLPADPRLPHAQAWFERHAKPGRTRVLRYVPLRRLTFAWQGDGGDPLIGKFKRRSRHAQAHRLIDHVATLVALGRPDFAVAQARQGEPLAGLYFQSALPGLDLADWLAPAAVTGHATSLRDPVPSRAALAHVGHLHAQLHALPKAGKLLPVQTDLSVMLDTACTQLAWIALMQPRCTEALRAVSARLHRTPGWQADEARVCHGDLVCSQFLVSPAAGATTLPTEPQSWAITDFDLCHVGDPCRDMAILLASLAYDLPGLAALERRRPDQVDRWVSEVGQAYLQGYADTTGVAVNMEGLVWHGLCAEVHYLALMLKKDRYDAVAFDRRLRHALALCTARNWT
jgi:hypothetical protein